MYPNLKESRIFYKENIRENYIRLQWMSKIKTLKKFGFE